MQQAVCIEFSYTSTQSIRVFDHTKTNPATQYVKLVPGAIASKQLGASKAICLQTVTDRAAKTELNKISLHGYANIITINMFSKSISTSIIVIMFRVRLHPLMHPLVHQHLSLTICTCLHLAYKNTIKAT